MGIRRTVPNISAQNIAQSQDFYVDFLGMQVAMEQDFITTYVSPSNPTAQISVIRADESGLLHPDTSVEVDDVNAIHAKAVEQGVEIVYPLTDEPWGVRRFFVLDPNGAVINVLSHNESNQK